MFCLFCDVGAPWRIFLFTFSMSNVTLIKLAIEKVIFSATVATKLIISKCYIPPYEVDLNDSSMKSPSVICNEEDYRQHNGTLYDHAT